MDTNVTLIVLVLILAAGAMGVISPRRQKPSGRNEAVWKNNFSGCHIRYEYPAHPQIFSFEVALIEIGQPYPAAAIKETETLPDTSSSCSH